MKHLIAAAAAALTLTLVRTADATPLQQKDVEQAIQKLEQKWNAGDAKGAAAIFGDDAQVVGEGSPTAVHGRAELDKAVATLVAGSKAIHIDLKQFVPTGPDSACTWVLWNITPRDEKEKPFTVRSLFLWKRGADGLRLRGDSYSVGTY